MAPFHEMGKMVLITGLLIAVIGLILMIGPNIPWVGRLPGDFLIKKERFTFFFPLGSCILISILLSLLFWFFRK